MVKFRKVLAGAIVASLALAVALAFSSPQPIQTDIAIRTSVANVNALGYIDTIAQGGGVNVTGAVQTLDTTVWFSGLNLDYQSKAANTAPYAIGRVFVWGAAAPTNMDTFFVAIDGSMDGVNVAHTGTFIQGLFATAGDKCAQLPFTVDGDLTSGGTVNSTLGGMLYPYLRFRLRPDGNTASVWAGVRVKFVHFEFNR